MRSPLSSTNSQLPSNCRKGIWEIQSVLYSPVDSDELAGVAQLRGECTVADNYQG